MNFIGSPELVIALALGGRLSFSPLIDELTACDGTRFKLNPPTIAGADHSCYFLFLILSRERVGILLIDSPEWKIIIIVINTNGWHWCEHRIVALKHILVYLIKQYYLFLGALFNWLKRMASLLQRFFRINNYHRLPRTSQILDISHS